MCQMGTPMNSAFWKLKQCVPVFPYYGCSDPLLVAHRLLLAALSCLLCDLLMDESCGKGSSSAW